MQLIVCNHRLSERRACLLVGGTRSVRYRSTKKDETSLRERIRKLAFEKRRFGYRRIHILLKREGVTVNHKKVWRLYREEGLKVRKRGGRKRSLGIRGAITVPKGPNEKWSLDFVHDALADGRKIRLLTIIDEESALGLL